MLTFNAVLLAGLDLVLSAVATATIVRAKEHLSARARNLFLAAVWVVYAGSLGAAVLVGPGASVGVGHPLQTTILWLAGLSCFLQVAAARAAADWKDLEAPARRNRMLSLAAMVALFVGLALWTVLT
jgi:hypothetical protein